MKQSRLFIVGMLLLSALSFSTKAADFSFTVNWDNPGAVQIIDDRCGQDLLDRHRTGLILRKTRTRIYNPQRTRKVYKS